MKNDKIVVYMSSGTLNKFFLNNFCNVLISGQYFSRTFGFTDILLGSNDINERPTRDLTRDNTT